MALHVIVGAGFIASATALQLSQRGHQVRVVSRSGGGPTAAGIERLPLDTTDADRLADALRGAASVFNCANPPNYDRWASDWPPLAAALLNAAERSSAVLVSMSNLYGYGPVDHPMTEDDPLSATGKKGRLRAKLWEDALAGHRAGRVRATEARASDYFGPGVVEQGHVGARTIPAVSSCRHCADSTRSAISSSDRSSWTPQTSRGPSESTQPRWNPPCRQLSPGGKHAATPLPETDARH